MKNHKQLLMDFYLNLLAIPDHDVFRITNQALYTHTRCALAIELDVDAETVQRIFERMAGEDKPEHQHCVKCDKTFASISDFKSHGC